MQAGRWAEHVAGQSSGHWDRELQSSWPHYGGVPARQLAHPWCGEKRQVAMPTAPPGRPETEPSLSAAAAAEKASQEALTPAGAGMRLHRRILECPQTSRVGTRWSRTDQAGHRGDDLPRSAANQKA